jgi:hypothetical protein
VKFADDNRRTGRHKPDDVTQNFDWIVSVVQYHRDQSRVCLHIIGLQRGCVCSDPLNVPDPTLLLTTLKMR